MVYYRAISRPLQQTAAHGAIHHSEANIEESNRVASRPALILTLEIHHNGSIMGKY